MFIDAQLRFSNAQDLSSGTGSGVLGTNVVDLKAAANDLGVGRPVYIVFLVTTALEGSGDTLDCEVVSDSVATLDSSLSVHQVVGTFAAQAAVNTRIAAPLPLLEGGMERYLGVRYFARGTGALTAGAVTSFLTLDVQSFTAYPDGFTIS